MERFFNNDPDDTPDAFHFDDDQYGEEYEDGEEEEMEAIAYMTSTDGIAAMMQMDIAQSELNQHLLEKAMKIAQQSFFWRFRSTTAKMQEIEEIYKKLLHMTEEEEDKEEEGDPDA
jgi:hypothetical protein